MIVAPGVADADTITRIGTFVGGGPTLENGYILRYSFDPISVPGALISFGLDFTGQINAMVGGASGINVATGNTITSVNVIPAASFASSLVSGPSLGFPNSATATGTQIAEAYNNAANISISTAPQAISLSGTSGTSLLPADTFSTANLAAVTLFAIPGNPFVIEPAGSTATFVGGQSYDRSTGSGTLRLTVNYTPASTVPEPASTMVLGAALLGLSALVRKRRSPPQ